MKPYRKCLLACWICLIASSNVRAELTTQLSIGGEILQLNGAGTRSKAFVQIYESGLYLRQPSQDAKAIVAADELMAIRVQITSRFVSRDSLVTSLKESLAKSTNGNTAAIAKETASFTEILKDEVKKNDVYDFVHAPGRGLLVLKNGNVQGTIPGLEFKKALFGIWLSDAPVDTNLRQAMLSGGRSAQGERLR